MSRKYTKTLNKVIIDLLNGRPQSWLAKESGLTTSTISRILNGESDPGIGELIELGRALNIRPDEILRLTLFPGGLPPPEMSERTRQKLKESEEIDARYKAKRQKAVQTLKQHAPYALDIKVPDVADSVEILSKFQGLSPSLKLLACAVLYEDASWIRELPVESRPLLANLLAAVQTQLQVPK